MTRACEAQAWAVSDGYTLHAVILKGPAHVVSGDDDDLL